MITTCLRHTTYHEMEPVRSHLLKVVYISSFIMHWNQITNSWVPGYHLNLIFNMHLNKFMWYNCTVTSWWASCETDLARQHIGFLSILRNVMTDLFPYSPFWKIRSWCLSCDSPKSLCFPVRCTGKTFLEIYCLNIHQEVCNYRKWMGNVSSWGLKVNGFESETWTIHFHPYMLLNPPSSPRFQHLQPSCLHILVSRQTSWMFLETSFDFWMPTGQCGGHLGTE